MLKSFFFVCFNKKFQYNHYMKNILVIGESPLPNIKSKNRTAYSLRTYQFFQSILKAQYYVDLLTIDTEAESYAMSQKSYNYKHFVCPRKKRLVIKYIKKFLKTYKYEALVSVNNYPSYLSAKAKPKIPFWADLNGWIMAEATSQAAVINDNAFLSFFYEREKKILMRADKISTVSLAQKYAVYGELAFIGRLNSKTNGYDFVSVIKNATDNFNEDIKDKKVFRGTKIPEDAFVVSFIGGYNTWVDEITLFKSLELSIKINPKIYYVSTGGAIKGLNDITYKNFLSLVKQSKYKDHYCFLGWVKTEDIPSIYKESDCGINTDKMCIETLTGARNRINEMIKYGLPVITTEGSEISKELKGVSLVVKNGDFEKISEYIIKLACNKELCKEITENQKTYASKNWNYLCTTKDLIAWLQYPKVSDKSIFVMRTKKRFRAFIRYCKQKGVLEGIKRIFR